MPEETPRIPDLKRERSYRFEKSSYDPRRFYTKSRDDTGHSDYRKVRFQPHISDQIDAVCSKGSPFPYKSWPEFVRDACYHRLAQLRELWEDETFQTLVENMMIDVELAETLASERKGREWVQTMVDEVDAVVRDYCRRGQPDVALEKLDYWLERIPRTEDSHHMYVRGYVRQKMVELRDTIAGKRRGS